MVVINNAQNLVGHQVDAQVQSTLQTGAGVIVFADLQAAPTMPRGEITQVKV